MILNREFHCEDIMNIEWIAQFVLLGLFVGFLSGLLGIGGGGILVPVLTSMLMSLGIAKEHVVHSALGTSLACMIFSSLASIRAHAAQKTIVWYLVKGLLPGLVIGVFLTTRFAVHISSEKIALFFVLFMMLTGIQMMINWKPKPNGIRAGIIELILVGICIGSIASLAAVGGGFLMIMYLTYKNIEMKNAVGTSAALGFPIALTGALGYIVHGWAEVEALPYAVGFVYLPAFLSISVGSFLAVSYGAYYANTLPETRLKQIFAALSFVLSVKMLYALC